jgi:hypothetical protein
MLFDIQDLSFTIRYHFFLCFYCPHGCAPMRAISPEGRACVREVRAITKEDRACVREARAIAQEDGATITETRATTK